MPAPPPPPPTEESGTSTHPSSTSTTGTEKGGINNVKGKEEGADIEMSNLSALSSSSRGETFAVSALTTHMVSKVSPSPDAMLFAMSGALSGDEKRSSFEGVLAPSSPPENDGTII
jgi:hypothetical protein